jgi:hypothetical protein
MKGRYLVVVGIVLQDQIEKRGGTLLDRRATFFVSMGGDLDFLI